MAEIDGLIELVEADGGSILLRRLEPSAPPKRYIYIPERGPAIETPRRRNRPETPTNKIRKFVWMEWRNVYVETDMP